jgi:hypothetical protein
MDSTKDDQIVIELDRGYYFCGECGDWHRLESDKGRKHLIHFDEDKTNSQNAKYIYGGLDQCKKWHITQIHFQYRWYIRLGSRHRLLVSPYQADSPIQSNLSNEAKENDLKNTSANPTEETLHGDKVLINTEEIVKYSLSAIENRKECLELAFDRGLGEGMKIEKWILTEMLSKLIELRKNEVLNLVEGEHKFPIKKKRNFEHCDLWWKIKDFEYWLEVKTVKEQSDVDEVRKDFDKKNRLKNTDVFYHLSIVLVKSTNPEGWKGALDTIYERNGMLHEADWCAEVDQNITLLYMLYCSPMNGDNV